MQTVRDMANGLQSETPYLDIANIPEDSLHVSEYVLKIAWETIKPIKQSQTNLQKEILSLR